MLLIPYNDLQQSVQPLYPNSKQKQLTWEAKSSTLSIKTIEDIGLVKSNTSKLVFEIDKHSLINLGFGIKLDVLNLNPCERIIAKFLIKRLHVSMPIRMIANRIDFVFLPDKIKFLFEICFEYHNQIQIRNTLIYLIGETISTLILKRDYFISKYLYAINKTIYLVCDQRYHNL